MSTQYETVVDQIIHGLVLIGQGWWNSVFQKCNFVPSYKLVISKYLCTEFPGKPIITSSKYHILLT